MIGLCGLIIIGCSNEEHSIATSTDSNKAYTKDEDGEIIFYDLLEPNKKNEIFNQPSPVLAKTFNVESTEKEINTFLKQNSEFIAKLSLIEKDDGLEIILKMNDTLSVGDGYLVEFVEDIQKAVRLVSKTLPQSPLKNIKVKQRFADLSALELQFQANKILKLKNPSVESVLALVEINNSDIDSEAHYFIKESCNDYLNRINAPVFCDLKDVKALDDTQSLVAQLDHSNDKLESLINNVRKSEHTKSKNLSIEQQTILKEAGFDTDI